MEILNEIPFSLDAVKLMEQLHIEPGSDDAGEFRGLMDVAVAVGKPEGCLYGVVRGGKTRRHCGSRWNLVHESDPEQEPGVQRTHLPIGGDAGGREMDEAFPAKGDMLKEFWWDIIKVHLLGAANRHLDDELHRKFRLGKTATMRPGSGDASVWPIEQQRELFTLLGDVEQAIGVPAD